MSTLASSERSRAFQGEAATRARKPASTRVTSAVSVAHRQVVLTVPERLRAYLVHDRRRLGLLSRVAARSLRGYVQAALGEREAVPGVIACV